MDIRARLQMSNVYLPDGVVYMFPPSLGETVRRVTGEYFYHDLV